MLPCPGFSLFVVGTRYMSSDLVVEYLMCRVGALLSFWSSIFWRLLVAVICEGARWSMTLSSIYVVSVAVRLCVAVLRAEAYMINRHGESADPCGTPAPKVCVILSLSFEAHGDYSFVGELHDRVDESSWYPVVLEDVPAGGELDAVEGAFNVVCEHRGWQGFAVVG